MNFLNDPRRERIEPMHELLSIWAQYWKDRPRQNVSSTWIAMCAVRDWSKRVKEIREGLVLGKPIRCTRTDNMMIAEKMMTLFQNEALWRFHRRERDVLVIYYLKVHPSEPIGSIARKLDCKPWQVELTVKDALSYIATIWSD